MRTQQWQNVEIKKDYVDILQGLNAPAIKRDRPIDQSLRNVISADFFSFIKQIPVVIVCMWLGACIAS